MGKNNYFQFKQFKVVQQDSAMKVGTDGILLGGWANPSDAKSILDIGTGTGLIALMLAQRCGAQITAIEIEPSAAREAVKNVKNSPWPGKVNVENCSLQEFHKTGTALFDLIVSNPPFFSEAIKSPAKNRTIARHTDSLPFNDLLFGAKKLLADSGKLTVILPIAPAKQFVEIAEHYGLYPTRLTSVYPNPKKLANRLLMEFSTQVQTPDESNFIIRDIENTYSGQYKNLLKDFYIAF